MAVFHRTGPRRAALAAPSPISGCRQSRCVLFYQHGLDLLVQHPAQEGDILQVKLALQGFVGSSHNDCVPAEQGGQEIGDGFARAGGGFDDGRAFFQLLPFDRSGRSATGWGVAGSHPKSGPGVRRCQKSRQDSLFPAGRGAGACRPLHHRLVGGHHRRRNPNRQRDRPGYRWPDRE